jgi:steroid delta-isomerase-like uncharacterized protein
MSSRPEDNAELVRRFYDEFFTRGNLAFADQVHADGYAYHDIANPDEVVDHAGYMERNQGFAAAFPDRRVLLDDVIATGDRVVARSTLRGTHTGDLGDIAATGRPVRIAAVIISRFEGGRIAEEWEIYDALGMYQQLGVPPPSG